MSLDFITCNPDAGQSTTLPPTPKTATSKRPCPCSYPPVSFQSPKFYLPALALSLLSFFFLKYALICST